MRKKPFDIDEVFRGLREATAPFARAALLELRDEGYTSAFEQLAACILSVRTRDETMLPVARRLFERARTPAALAALSVDELDGLIRESSFHRAKAENLLEIARRVVDEHGGEPVMLGFRGVGAALSWVLRHNHLEQTLRYCLENVAGEAMARTAIREVHHERTVAMLTRERGQLTSHSTNTSRQQPHGSWRALRPHPVEPTALPRKG